jgi:hypothetical protein
MSFRAGQSGHLCGIGQFVGDRCCGEQVGGDKQP